METSLDEKPKKSSIGFKNNYAHIITFRKVKMYLLHLNKLSRTANIKYNFN